MLPAPPEGRRRTAVSIFIAAFALAAVALPLRYYLGSDRYDERFSWRMFSAVHLESCETEYHEAVKGDDNVIELDSVLERTFAAMIRRSREQVIWRFLASRCERPGVRTARLITRCKRPGGGQLPAVERSRWCRSGEEHVKELAP